MNKLVLVVSILFASISLSKIFFLLNFIIEQVIRIFSPLQVIYCGFANCGNQQYNTAFNLCCNGTVASTSGILSPQCCGKQAYGSTFKICCAGNVLSTGAKLDPACCGAEVYDKKFNKCCLQNNVTKICQKNVLIIFL